MHFIIYTEVMKTMYVHGVGLAYYNSAPQNALRAKTWPLSIPNVQIDYIVQTLQKELLTLAVSRPIVCEVYFNE